MITAREKGRSLELIVGGGDDTLEFLVPPLSAGQGATLLAGWLGIAFGQVPVDESADKMVEIAQLALSKEVYDQIVDLRWGEQEQLVNSAFMWNVQGGGIDLVVMYLEGGLPKARAQLLDNIGMSGAWEALQASLASVTADLVSTAGLRATTIPSGSAKEPTDPPLAG